jgi:hypothetical protein
MKIALLKSNALFGLKPNKLYNNLEGEYHESNYHDY